ncbi:MAG TPA: TonB family protein [Chthoniobacterales bacterium]|nr:TonB family protein [Chthoniobacterales bacterium]
MPKNARFWRNVTLIGFAHTAVIAGFVHWSRESKKAPAQSIVWMGGSGSEGSVTTETPPPSTISARPPVREPDLDSESRTESASERDRPVLASAKSEIELPAARSSATSAPTRKPSATPKVKVTPHPTPKPKPRPTATPKPKPSPRKVLLAKASPKPLPSRTENKEEETNAEEQLKAPTAPALSKTGSRTGEEKEAPVGVGAGRGAGGSNQSQFGWYGSMLHDRFYSEWVQPTNVGTSGAKNSVLAKLRIENDGRVSNFEIVKPSGNAMVDESVAAVGKRVTQVDPLPPGLGDGEHYDVKINFELNSE